MNSNANFEKEMSNELWRRNEEKRTEKMNEKLRKKKQKEHWKIHIAL